MSTKEKVRFLTTTYPLGILCGLAFWFFWLVGRVNLQGLENIPKDDRGNFWLPSHPSLWEPPFLIGLLLPRFFFHPLSRGPRTIVAVENYTGKWWTKTAEPALIPVDRNPERDERSTRNNAISLLKACRILKKGGNVICFPEAGRTFTGKTWCHSRRGKRIRLLDQGFAQIAKNSKARMIPLWVEWEWMKIFGFDLPKRMFVLIGEPMESIGEEVAMIAERVQNRLLELADKVA
jgi:1-acyl-sn-glycerol-3-phosphate acyltransferase